MSTRNAFRLGLLILLVGFALRWSHLAGRTSVWRDEAQDFALVNTADSPGELCWSLREEGHPPLHYLIEYVVQHRLGGGERALRVVVLVFGMGTVLLAMLLGMRLFGARCGLLAGLLTATSPYFIYYSAEMRAYGLFGFLGLVHAFAYLRYLRRPTWSAAVLWGISAAAMMYAHYYAFFIVLAGGLFALLRDRSDRNVLRIVAAGAVAAALFAPWVPSFLAQLGHDLQPWNMPDRKLRSSGMLLYLPLGKLGALICLWGLIAGIMTIRRGGVEATRATALRGLILISFVAALVAWLVQHRRGPFIPRYLIAMAGPFVVAVCFRWSLLFDRTGWPRRVAVGLIAVAVLFQWTDNTRWLLKDISAAAEIAQRIEAHEREGDLIWISPAFFAPSFNYHYRGKLKSLTPPYRHRVTHVSWVDLPEREQNVDLIAGFLDDLEQHLKTGRRVWLVLDGYYPVAKRFADLRTRGFKENPPLVRYELQIHKRVLRLLYDYAEDVYLWDGPVSDYHENMTLVLFDPAKKR